MEPVAAVWDQLSDGVPLIGKHPRWTAALLAGAGLAGCAVGDKRQAMADMVRCSSPTTDSQGMRQEGHRWRGGASFSS